MHKVPAASLRIFGNAAAEKKNSQEKQLFFGVGCGIILVISAFCQRRRRK